MRFVFSLIVSMLVFVVIANSASALTNQYGCGTLSTPGETYALQNNVSSNGTCFTITANNITLDLNGYKVTYANVTFEQIYNNDFEIENSTNPNWPAGWDLSQAPNVVRATGSPFDSQVYSGNYSLQINTPTTTQIIKTTQPVLLKPGITYTLGYLFFNYENNNCKGTPAFEVVDEFDNVIKYQEHSPDLDSCSPRGFMFFPRMYRYSTYTPQPDTTITVTQPTNAYIKIIWRNADTAPAGKVYIDFVTLAATHLFGVETNVRHDVTVTNGIINQSNIYCRECHVTDMNTARNSTFSYLTAHFGGISTTFYGIGRSNDNYDGYGFSAHHNTLIHNGYYGFNPINIVPFRDWIHYMIGLGRPLDSPVSIHDNKLLGHIQGGINPADVRSGGSCEIYNNYIEGHSRYVNGFGINACPYNARVYNNTINLSSGRGLAMGMGGFNSSIYDNRIYNREQRHNEPGFNRYVYGVQFECSEGGCTQPTNFSFYNNYVESKTHPDGVGAYALRFTGTIGSGEIYNNTFVAINEHPTLGYLASVFSFYYPQFPPDLKFYNNTFRSNNQILSFTSGTASNLNFESDTFEKIDPPEGIDFYTLYYIGAGTNTVFLDTKLINGANFDDVRWSGATSDFTVKWFLDIEALEGSNPAQGASVDIYDRNQALVLSGNTDMNGRVHTNLTEYINNFGTKTNSSPYNVTVTYGNETQSRIVTLNESKTEVFQFGNVTCPDFNNDNTVNIIDLVLVIFWQGKNSGQGDWQDYRHLDVIQDDVINFADVSAVISSFGQSC